MSLRHPNVDYNSNVYPLHVCEACGAKPSRFEVIWWERERIGTVRLPGQVERHYYCADHQDAADAMYKGLASAAPPRP